MSVNLIIYLTLIFSTIIYGIITLVIDISSARELYRQQGETVSDFYYINGLLRNLFEIGGYSIGYAITLILPFTVIHFWSFLAIFSIIFVLGQIIKSVYIFIVANIRANQVRG